MLYPTIDDVQSLLNDYPVVPVFYEALADTFTPIHIFDALQQDEETCFILESVDNRSQWGRYSFIGVRPKMELRIENGTAVKITENGEEHTPFTDLAAFLSGVMKDLPVAVLSQQAQNDRRTYRVLLLRHRPVYGADP